MLIEIERGRVRVRKGEEKGRGEPEGGTSRGGFPPSSPAQNLTGFLV